MTARYSTPPPVTRYPIGTGIWIARPAGEGRVTHEPATVVGWNRIAGAYLVATERNPFRAETIGPSRIRPRLKGELGPGVTAPRPGDAA